MPDIGWNANKTLIKMRSSGELGKWQYSLSEKNEHGRIAKKILGKETKTGSNQL